MRIPSLIGRDLSEAQARLGEIGLQVNISHTSPPGGAPRGPLRVVRQRLLGEGVEVVAAASIALSEGEDVRE